MGLRLEEGLPDTLFDEFSNKINDLIQIGMLRREDGVIKTTPAGKPLLNAVLRELLA